MDLSVNQLVSETKKAVCGKGYDFGIALDIAKAVETLAPYPFDISSALSDFLQNEDNKPCHFSIKDENTITVSGCAGLISVIGAMDLFLSKGYQSLSFEELQNPCLSLGLIAMRQSPYFGDFALASGMSVSMMLQQGQLLASHSVMIQKNAFAPMIITDWPARIWIDDDTYELLKSFAHKTYVPSSEASRAAGAGAGLTDND